MILIDVNVSKSLHVCEHYLLHLQNNPPSYEISFIIGKYT